MIEYLTLPSKLKNTSNKASMTQCGEWKKPLYRNHSKASPNIVNWQLGLSKVRKWAAYKNALRETPKTQAIFQNIVCMYISINL